MAGGDAEPARLAEARDPRGAVGVAGLARAEVRAALADARVEPLDLVVVGVGDEEDTRVPDDAERVLEAHVRRPGAVAVAELEEPLADDRSDRPARPGLDHADRARLAVGDVEEPAVGREAARLVHRRRLARPVLQGLAAGAGVGRDHAALG